jgi:hypothetical protein
VWYKDGGEWSFKVQFGEESTLRVRYDNREFFIQQIVVSGHENKVSVILTRGVTREKWWETLSKSMEGKMDINTIRWIENFVGKLERSAFDVNENAKNAKDYKEYRMDSGYGKGKELVDIFIEPMLSSFEIKFVSIDEKQVQTGWRSLLANYWYYLTRATAFGGLYLLYHRYHKK